MSNIHEMMIEYGLTKTDQEDKLMSNTASDYSISTFSGYGAYTPITVRSHTKITDADVERNRQRNQQR